MLPVTSQAAKHTHWVMTSALASSEVLFAVLAAGAASLFDLEEGTNSGSTGLLDASDHRGTISAHDAILFKIIAVKLLRSAVDGDNPPKLEFLLYSVLCLMVAEVNIPLPRMKCSTITRCEDSRGR
jgi:hypothetical protein